LRIKEQETRLTFHDHDDDDDDDDDEKICRVNSSLIEIWQEQIVLYKKIDIRL
jgi:hypothetical protein